MFLIYYFFLSCVTDVEEKFDREVFENEWWELQQYPICFRFHYNGYSNQFLTYETSIVNQGTWEFVDPNKYVIGEETLTVVQDEDCWQIDGYKNYSVDACDCTLLTWAVPRDHLKLELNKPVIQKKVVK